MTTKKHKKIRNLQFAVRNQNSRRGILLLVVLSILTLFLLIGTAFIVTANQYRRANKAQARASEVSNSSIDQQDLLNDVLNQLVRDTNNPNSSLRFHSLLRDMYGNDGILGAIGDGTGAAPEARWAGGGTNGGVTGGQMVEFTLELSTVTNQFGVSLETLSALDRAYNGLVLTFLDGVARGQSVRIVGHAPIVIDPMVPNEITAQLRVMSPRLVNGATITDPTLLNGSRILINGRPFNGTGTGYDPTVTGANVARLSTFERVNGTNRELALLPNAPFFDFNQVDTNGAGTFAGYYSNAFGSLTAQQQLRLVNGMGPVGLGGSDESYDAVDFQNMILAMMPTNPDEFVQINNPHLGNMVLPSFHRPALINYWKSQVGGLESEPNLLRKILLRPNWLDHPNFTGSNPEYANRADNLAGLNNMIYGPWDVDNDNDGVRDSVWVDFGAPVMENADGRLVKPLAAVLVFDMDGRLNLNAHGSEDIAAADLNPPTIPAVTPQQLAGTGNMSDILPHGIGYGPAEISLAPLMPGGNKAARWPWYKRFFEGAEVNMSLDATQGNVGPNGQYRFVRRTHGKYGRRVTPTDLRTRPVPGIDEIEGVDIASLMKMQGVPRWANGNLLNSNVRGGYASLPDFRGRYALGLNDLGQPVYEAVADINRVNAELDINTPYELDLSLRAARGENASSADSPFLMAELERVLRAYDADAGALPSRLWDLAGEFKDNPTQTTPNLNTLNLWRATATTDSYDLPVPSVTVPKWMVVGRDGTPDTADDYARRMGKPATGASFADLLEYRIRDEIGIDTNVADPTVAQLNAIRQQMNRLLPPDLADGLRLDINRPLGNGRDDNNNGVVDEPGEWDDVVNGNNNGQFDRGEGEAAYWVTDDTRPVDTRLNTFTDANTGQFRDDRILLEDWDNDGVFDANIDRGLIGLSADGLIDEPQELVIAHNMRRQMLARDLYVLAMTLADPVPVPPGGVTDATYLEKSAQRSRKLAQWAINVVDFRDPDNIMTAFEYDINPFDGWSADGNLATQNDIYGADGRAGGTDDQGGLIWGSERPELLITETLAWHDRATENTNKEDPANDEDGDGDINDDDQGTVPLNADQNAELPDRDYDQRLRPKGAAFVELYCPWPENPAVNLDTYVDDGNGALAVDIARTHNDTPNNRDTTDGSPVWRLMMYKDGGPGKDPDSLSQDLRPRLPDRSVYFVGRDPNYPAPARMHPDATDPQRYVNDGVAFFNDISRAVPPVRPGGYMVVGSGEDKGQGTFVSSLSSSTTSVAYTDQGISLNPRLGTVRLQDANGTPIPQMTAGGSQFNVVADRNVDVAIINRVADGSPNGELRRFTFSEPALGYPDRVEGSRFNSATGAYEPVVDVPLDDQRALFERGRGFTQPAGNGGLLQSKRTSELNDGEIRLTLPGFRQGRGFGGAVRAGGGMRREIERASRTIPGFKWVYLQRLANPLLPWNPEPLLPDGTTRTPGYNENLAVNPYMTIDSMGVNMTVYTGLSTEERRVDPTNERDPILRFRNEIPIDSLVSVQRGRDNDPMKPADPSSLSRLQERLAQRPDNDILQVFKDSTKESAVANNLWNPEPIGYIDGTVAGYWKNETGPNRTGVNGTDQNFNGVPDCTLGFLNAPFRAANDDRAPSDQRPAAPFSWLTWNNRPFANSGELMQVPAFSPSRLLTAYSMRGDGVDTNNINEEIYNGAPNERQHNSDTPKDWIELLDHHTDGSFGHLLNFFRSANTGNGGGAQSIEETRPAGLVRLLDYVHVPSPYVGTETWISPQAFGDSVVTATDDPRYLRQPPLNRISEFREPGRVNLNTMVNQPVYDGLMHGEFSGQVSPNTASRVHPGPTWETLMGSRRGWSRATSLLTLSNNSPTFFENPYRSADACNLVPLDSMRQPIGLQATLLRAGVAPPMGFLAAQMIGREPPVFTAAIAAPYNDANRNSYFRYQPITRLSSMTTNRSNVYAVWITVGFFEVTEAPSLADFRSRTDPSDTLSDDQAAALYKRVYPDGYQFGQEAGSDTGDIRRVRSFAMIDRTVPVAFEPGQNHNVDKAIRLRRRIE